MKRTTHITATAVAFAALSALPLGAETEVRETISVTPGQTATATTTYQIGPDEREVIRKYVKTTERVNLPSGFTRVVEYDETFPKTWREKVMVGQPLPEVYYRRGARLPGELVGKLPPQPEGTALVAIDGTVVRIEEPTRRVLDVYTIEEID